MPISKHVLFLSGFPLTKQLKKDLQEKIKSPEGLIVTKRQSRYEDSLVIGKITAISFRDKQKTNTITVEGNSNWFYKPEFNLRKDLSGLFYVELW